MLRHIEPTGEESSQELRKVIAAEILHAVRLMCRIPRSVAVGSFKDVVVRPDATAWLDEKTLRMWVGHDVGILAEGMLMTVEQAIEKHLAAYEPGAPSSPPPQPSIDAQKLSHVGVLLSSNGCDCVCEHGASEHNAGCTMCLACRIGEAIQ